MPRRYYGHFPSPPDSRDYDAKLLIGGAQLAAPVEYTSLVSLVEIHDQGPTNTCVWQAIAQAMLVFLKEKDPASARWLSTLFGYWNTLKLQNMGMTDQGCVTREALQVLSQIGYCAESAWPFDPSKVLQQPMPDVYTAATDQQQKTQYYRIYSTGDQRIADIKSAISQGYPVIWATPVDGEYESYSGGILGPRNGQWLGSHQRCLVGYTADYVIEANSWGTGWGENGFSRISWEYITWPYSIEFWVFTAAPFVSSVRP
jgi:hypothetical protein